MTIPDPTLVDWVPLWSAGPVAGYVPGVRVYKTATQSINNATWTVVTFDAETGDTDGIHDNITLNSRLTCRTAGKYLVWGLCQISANVTGDRLWTLRMNGTDMLYFSNRGAINNATTANIPGSIVLDLIPGDYLEMAAYQESGSALTINTQTHFGMTLLGPNIALGAVIPPTYGTTLPSNPADGQEAILVDSLTNPTYQWRFRYNAGSTSAYKWEYIGGTPMFISTSNDESTASSTYVALTTPLQLAFPRSGDYDIVWSCNSYFNTGSGTSYMGISLAGATPVSPLTTYAGIPTGLVETLIRSQRMTGQVSTVVVATRHAVGGGGTGNFRDRWLQITPVRVS